MHRSHLLKHTLQDNTCNNTQHRPIGPRHPHRKLPITPSKLVYTRPKHLLTEHTLNQYLNNNNIIQTAYNYTDPDLIAEIIVTQYNNIIEIIAPRTIRQLH